MKTSTILSTLCLLAIFCACEKENTESPIGLWPTIELSQSKVFFDSNGGSATVKANNYDTWWLEDIYVVDSDEYYPADSTMHHAAGNGISAHIGEAANTVVISVDPSTDSHEWILNMECGDAFTSIQVYQN